MGLYKRGNIWWMSFTYDRKQCHRSTGTRDRKLAEKIYDILKGRIAMGQWAPEEQQDRNYTFHELADKYLDWCKGRQRSWRVKYYITKMLCARFGQFYLSEITNATVEQLQSEYLDQGKTPAYVNKITNVFKHMFTKAYDWEMIPEDVLKRLRKAKPLKGENKRLRFLSKEEIHQLVSACEPYLKSIVITALNTGMRKSEILNLRWDQVDFRHGFILLDKTKNGERREIPINQTLRETLQALPRRLDIPYVFYNPKTGKPYTKDLKRSFQTALRKAGIKDFHFHDLRHTFASQLVMAGVDITTVKDLLGHKTLTMTLRYAHLAPSHKVEAVKKYDIFLNEKKGLQEVKTG
jgi:integrase